ncbi:MAG: FecR domain-containing protein [Paracraurococcus sp.]|jgi:transmembrane sensor
MQTGDQAGRDTPAAGAARRLARLTSRRADALDKAELERWRAADPCHERAWQEALALWQATGALRRDRAGLARAPSAAPRRAMFGLGLLGVAGGLGVCWDRGGPARLLADLATGTAETVLDRGLADGSVLSLDARSAVDLDIGRDRRLVRLRSGGLHAVAAAGPVPFTVQAGTATVALDAAAALYVGQRGGNTQVAVAEGAARLQPRLGAPMLPLPAGRLVEITPAGQALPARRVAIPAIAAWRRGRLVAEDRPLPELAEELGAHFRGAILLRGEAARRRVSAALDLADIPAALATLADVLGGRLTWPVPRVGILHV